MNLKGTQTIENILRAYSKELQVSAKYNFYGSVAENEQLIEVSRIFFEVAREELAHAKRFYEFIKEEFQSEKIYTNTEYNIDLYSNTFDNLKAALLGENDVWRELYPKYAKTARVEGFYNIANTFELFSKAEKVHEEIFIKMFNDIKNDRMFKSIEPSKWICINCGVISEGKEPPLMCPGCMYPKGYFKKHRER